MKLMFYHSALWKCYCDQATIIHIVSLVQKGASGDVACKHLLLWASTAKEFFVNYPLCIML